MIRAGAGCTVWYDAQIEDVGVAGARGWSWCEEYIPAAAFGLLRRLADCWRQKPSPGPPNSAPNRATVSVTWTSFEPEPVRGEHTLAFKVASDLRLDPRIALLGLEGWSAARAVESRRDLIDL